MRICKVDSNYKCSASDYQIEFCGRSCSASCPNSMNRAMHSSSQLNRIQHDVIYKRIEVEIKKAISHMASKSYVKSEINSALKSHKDIGHESCPIQEPPKPIFKISVNFKTSKKNYNYYCHEVIKKGEYVIVESPYSGYEVVKVSVGSKAIYKLECPAKGIIQKLNIEDN